MRYDLTDPPDASRCVQKIFEDIPGGCTIVRDELKNGASGFMSEGILISLDNPGMGYLVKTAKIYSDVSLSATGINVYKEHEFKTGDIVSNTALTTISRTILDIDTTSNNFDVFTIVSGFGNMLTGEILIQASASGVSGTDASWKYIPDAIGVSERPVNMAYQNNGFGLLVRGTMDESEMPFYIDASIKALFPLIRFV